MRLLETSTLELSEFVEGSVPKYAILSHTWGDGEVLFRDLEKDPSAKAGWTKIQSACRVARERGFSWIWIDTCCIDKASSSELSEAINSMFRWYQEAGICLAYLSDVVYSEPGDDECKTSLAGSRWFTRGWTLQELLAPLSLDFYSQDWTRLGSRTLFRSAIEKTTGIERNYLSGERRLDSASVAERMSWASQRITTRVEDTAYCLLGIFDINMPLIYGEGIKAFQRLQEAIIRDNDDQSIFAWGNPHEGNMTSLPHLIEGCPLLASSPKDFTHSGDIIRVFDVMPSSRVRIENSGITITTPLLLGSHSKWVRGPSTAFLAPLLCRRRSDTFNTIALALYNTIRFSPDRDDPDGMSYCRVSRQLFTFPTTAWVRERLCSAFIYFKFIHRFTNIPGIDRAYAPEWGCAIRTLPKSFHLGVPYSVTWDPRASEVHSGGLPITGRLVRSYGLASPIVIPLRGPSLQENGCEGSLALVLQYQYMTTNSSAGDSVMAPNALSWDINGMPSKFARGDSSVLLLPRIRWMEGMDQVRILPPGHKTIKSDGSTVTFEITPSWMINRVVVVPPGFTIENVANTVQVESEAWPAEYVRRISGASIMMKAEGSTDLFDRSSLRTFTRFHVGVSTERVHGNLLIVDVEDSGGSNVSLEVDHNGMYTPVKGIS